MDNRLEKLDGLNEMHKSGALSKEEYKSLVSEILNSKSEINLEFGTNKVNSTLDVNKIKNAGKNALKIFYCLICEVLIAFVYWFFIGFNHGYSEATGNSENIITKILYILEFYNTFYIIEFIIFIIIMQNLYELGVNLKNVNFYE